MKQQRIAAEDGLSLVELLVAMTVLVVGILAFIQATVPSQRSITSSEVLATEADVADQEIDRIVSLGYAGVGLASAPTQSSNPDDPRYYVRSGNRFQWDRDVAANDEPLCLPATGCTGSLATGPITWSSGQMTGSLYRYVTWVDDPCDPTASPQKCPTTTDYKRITLAVTHSGAGYPKTPYLVSTIVADPSAMGPG